MKNIVVLFTALFVLSFLSTSCNKKLKDEMEELESSLNEEKSKSETLQGQVNNLNGILFKTPMAVSFSTTDDDDAAVTFGGNYSFVYGSDYSHSYVSDNQDGTYYVYIWRGNDLETDFAVSISFTYNPTTTAVTNISAAARGYGANGQEVNTNFNGTSEISQTVSVTAFDFNAGMISFNYSGSTTAAYGNYFSGNPMTLTSSYSGTLAKYYEPILW